MSKVIDVQIEKITNIRARVDLGLFVSRWSEEWKEYLDGAEPTDEDYSDFLKESIFAAGVDDFVYADESEGVTILFEDSDLDIWSIKNE